MSVKNKSVDYLWKNVIAQLSRPALRHSSGLLTQQDVVTVQEVMLLWCMVIDDSINRVVGTKHATTRKSLAMAQYLPAILGGMTRPIDAWLGDVKRLLGVLLSKDFRVALATHGFKHLRTAKIPSTKWLISLFERFERVATLDIVWSEAYQILSFPMRLTLTLDELDEEAYELWLDMNNRSYPLWPRYVEEFIRNHMPKVERLFGRHSDGATAVSQSSVSSQLGDKLCDHRVDPVMEYLMRKDNDFVRFPFDLADRVRAVQMPTILKAVPKGFDAKRVIGMEPATKQYLQQAIKDVLYRHIATDEYLSQHINLTSNIRHQNLARIGSINGSYVTIDLSSASDTVAWLPLRSALRGSPWYPYILAARSRYAHVNGRYHRMTMASPMGSALCFPLETLVFAGFCQHAVNVVSGRPCRSNYSVYGDDIVIESQYADTLIKLLEDHGFLVNRSKTYTDFTDFTFRETCGKDYLNGVDVSPARIPRNFRAVSELETSPDQFGVYIELANRLIDVSPTARLFLVRRLLRLPKRMLPSFRSRWDCDEECAAGALLTEGSATNYRQVHGLSPVTCCSAGPLTIVSVFYPSEKDWFFKGGPSVKKVCLKESVHREAFLYWCLLRERQEVIDTHLSMLDKRAHETPATTLVVTDTSVKGSRLRGVISRRCWEKGI